MYTQQIYAVARTWVERDDGSHGYSAPHKKPQSRLVGADARGSGVQAIPDLLAKFLRYLLFTNIIPHLTSV
jgi:hypothetical protein